MIESTPPLPRFERTLIRAMLAGVSLSASLLALGLVLRLASDVPGAADTFDFLSAGLIVLMATPVLRVVLSIAEAVRQRDWFWLWATVAVAVVLSGTVVYSLRTLR